MTEGLAIRYFGAAKQAAGAAVDTAAAAPLAAVAAELAARRGQALAAVLGYATFLVDGHRAERDNPAVLPPGTTVDILPPFAGG
ncbi:MAG: MoaD/ThiS family protein [Propionibacteriaceae bacterium]|jgi:molybdopterin converting factor small subunit|nr:MoaD/ThiS family protein [Propionibacteriaceae bacterium]